MNDLHSADANSRFNVPKGELALAYCNLRLPLTVLKSAKGYYLGTADKRGPVSRESVEYWSEQSHAKRALEGVEGVHWTQRGNP